MTSEESSAKAAEAATAAAEVEEVLSVFLWVDSMKRWVMTKATATMAVTALK